MSKKKGKGKKGKALRLPDSLPTTSPAVPVSLPGSGSKAVGQSLLQNSIAGRALAGRRLTIDNEQIQFGNTKVIVPPLDYESYWRLADLDTNTLNRINPFDLIEMLSDLSPDVSRALWDFLRLCNPGWEVKAYNVGSDVVNQQAQTIIDMFLLQLKELYGAADIPINRLFLGGFVRGGIFAELVLNPGGRVPVDLATPDPASARFQKEVDPVRGQIHVLGQWQQRKFVILDRPTIKYIPVDPMPGKPYGRAPAAPAIFPTLFLLGLLHDLRRVVAQQGYPRIDLSIDQEKLQTTMPPNLMSDPSAYKAWVEAIYNEVQDIYSNLEPDDAYIHTDIVVVNRPVGTVDTSSLGGIDSLVRLLERMSIRALKTSPFMMGVSESATETQANRQWEHQLQGIKAIQHLVEQMLELLLTVAINAQGIQAEVKWRFAENRASEMLRDQQTLRLKIANYIEGWKMGWTDQDESAQATFGHSAVEEEPRVVPGADKGGEVSAEEKDATQVEEPGSNKALTNGHIRENEFVKGLEKVLTEA